MTNYLNSNQKKQLKKNADLLAKDAKFIQDGWINLPETPAFTVKTDVKFFNAMLEVMDAVPEVFEKLSIAEAFMLANMLLTDWSSYVAGVIWRKFSFNQTFKIYHDGLWISPFYQSLYSVEDLTALSNGDIL